MHALDLNAGRVLWHYFAGARVDSPPTYWKGRLYFGSRDGSVYCLRAEDGALIWRYRAVADRRLGAFEQAIQLSEEKYCSVGIMLGKTARIQTEYKILKPGEKAE